MTTSKQPIKKGSTIVRKSMSDIKKSIGLVQKSSEDYSVSSAEKPIDFFHIGDAFSEATKLPGIPMGYTTILTGWSNTGKSTIKNMLIASCQRKGVIPVIYETEQNFDFSYAIDCGMQAEPIYGMIKEEVFDEETGEISIVEKEGIVDYEGMFIYFDNSILAKTYGHINHKDGSVLSEKNRRETPVLEDIAYSIKDLLEKQRKGEIDRPLCFIWDSVGSIESFKSYDSKTGNNMFDAGAIASSFNSIVNNYIPVSRRIDKEYTNTFLCVNKIWTDNQNSMGGAISLELKGGKTLFYGARLIIHLGGKAKSSVKALYATSKGEKYQYGIETKISTTKNQLPSPYNTTFEGNPVCCVHNGMIKVDSINDYKKEYMPLILSKLQDKLEGKIDEADITFTEEIE